MITVWFRYGDSPSPCHFTVSWINDPQGREGSLPLSSVPKDWSTGVAYILCQTLNSFESLVCLLSWSSAAAISVKDSNGTFISTLNLLLYNVSSQSRRPKFPPHSMNWETGINSLRGAKILCVMRRTRPTFSSCRSPWQDSPWRLACLPLWKLTTWTRGARSKRPLTALPWTFRLYQFQRKNEWPLRNFKGRHCGHSLCTLVFGFWKSWLCLARSCWKVWYQTAWMSKCERFSWRKRWGYKTKNFTSEATEGII